MVAGRHLGLGWVFFGPSKLTLPFDWVQKQDYTEAPTKGCPSRVRTLPSPSRRHWITEMKAEGGHMPSPCLPCSSDSSATGTTHRQTPSLGACPGTKPRGKRAAPKGLSVGHSFRARHPCREAAQSQDCEKWGLASGGRGGRAARCTSRTMGVEHAGLGCSWR